MADQSGFLWLLWDVHIGQWWVAHAAPAECLWLLY
jgi:hypothetical protein